MPTISFKKDEVRLLSAVFNEYRIRVSDEAAEYEKRVEAGETLGFYDERELMRLNEKIEWCNVVAYKLSRAIYPTGAM